MLEEMPAAPAANAALDEEYAEAVGQFAEAVSSGNVELQGSLFSKIIDLSIRRHSLPGMFEALEESKRVKKEMDDIAGEAEELYDYFHSTAACHGQDPYRQAEATQWMSAVKRDVWGDGVLEKQTAVVLERERIREAALSAVEEDLFAALSVVDEEMPIDDGMTREETLQPVVASMFADTFRSLSDFDRAKKYYNLASVSPMQTATGAVWYRLQALEMDILSGDRERVRAAAEEIEEMRGELTNLLAGSYAEEIESQFAVPEDPNTVEINIEGPFGTAQAIGSPDEVHQIDALSWGILYDAYVETEQWEKMEALETERRQMVKGRIGEASQLEARLHLENMERVALIKTVPGGILQRTSREDGVLAAQDIHSRLMEDLGDVGHLIDPYMTPERGDALFEHFAALNWSVHVNGYLMRDLPQMALEQMDEHILQVYDLWLEVPFKDTNYVDMQIAKLKEFAPQIFRADGSIDPYLDLSGTSGGTNAADRTMTAYWRRNDSVREKGLPIGSAVTCFLIGTIFFETIVVPAMLAGACSAGASLGNREMNIASASEQYRQAAATGITMVSADEASRRSRAWYAMEGLNAAFNAALVAPMAGVWGRVGGAAIREGLAGATASAAARSILSSFTSPLAAMGRVGSSIAGGTVNAAKWFWKLPVGSRLRLAGFAPAAVDGFFVDRQGNLVGYDGELNHWWGYAGMAAGMSETGFRLFRSAWQPGFSAAVSRSALREGAIHLGTDLIASDYYLIRNGGGGMQFVDFNAPRDTALQEHAFQKQFAVDTWLGFAGTVLVSGDWLQNELRFGMTNWDRGLLISGAVPTGYDIISDGQLDSWYGGVGGSVVAAEMGYRLLNVNPAGSMVFLPMKLSYEWLMQAQQDVPLQAPDPQRMISSTVESIFMMMLVNGTYQGGHYWNTFPMGQSIFNAGQRLPLLNNLRCIEDLSRLSFLGGSRPAIQSWSRGTAVRPFATNGAVRTYKLRGDKAWNGLAEGKEDVMLTVSVTNGSAVFNLNGSAVTEADLLRHGMVWNNNTLYRFNPIREESINLGGRRMTVQDVGMLNDGARARAMSQLRNSGWRIEGDRFSRWWVQRPYHPEVLTTRPTGPMSTSQFKIVESSIPGANGEQIPVWLKFDRVPVYADSVRLGGRDLPIWSGQREKPHFGFWGVALSGPPVLAEAYASNYFIFRRTSRGDPDYQPLQRFANYVPTVFFT